MKRFFHIVFTIFYTISISNSIYFTITILKRFKQRCICSRSRCDNNIINSGYFFWPVTPFEINSIFANK